MRKESKNNITNFPGVVFGTYFGMLFDESGHTSCGNWFYSAYFILLSYGIIFRGNSADSSKVCINQIKSFSLMGGIKQGVSCRRLCNIRHLESVYLFSLLLFVVDKMEILKQICKSTA